MFSGTAAPRASRAKSCNGSGGAARRTKISKALAFILLHGAQRQGLALRSDGFCFLQLALHISALRNLHTTMHEVHVVLHTRGKLRYELAMLEDQVMIRAFQGHSIRFVLDEHLLPPLDPHRLPAACVHVTYSKA